MRTIKLLTLLTLCIQLNAQNVGFSDCVTYAIPCSKNFHINQLSDFGTNNREVKTEQCINSESFETNSIWLKFEITSNGSFAFDLIPEIQTDDLDFTVYKYQNSCENLQLTRCMAAGKNLGTIYNNSARCQGKTGLNLQSADFNEPSGCFGLADNYLSAFQVKQGESYLVFINNYRSSNGFTFQYTGSAEFLTNQYPPFQKKINFENEKWTYQLTHENAQGFGGCFVNWSIIDGEDNIEIEGVDANNIVFTTPGSKKIIRNITNSLGCEYTDTSVIQITSIHLNPKKKKEIIASEVFPNPAKNLIYIEILNPALKDLSLRIINTTGVEVLGSEKLELSSYQIYSQKIDKLISGVYYVNIYEGNSRKILHSKKFIVLE